MQIVADLTSQHPWREALWSTAEEETETQGDHGTCPGPHSLRLSELQSPLQSGPRVPDPSPWWLLSPGLQCQQTSRASRVDSSDWLEAGVVSHSPPSLGSQAPVHPISGQPGFSKCAPLRVSPGHAPSVLKGWGHLPTVGWSQSGWPGLRSTPQRRLPGGKTAPPGPACSS